MFAVVLALLPLALGVAAAPLMHSAATTWCPDSLGLGAFDVATNFTLAAYNTTGTNANTTGVPLVMGFGGAIPGAEFKMLSTYASYPYNDFPSFGLKEGALIPQDGPEGLVISNTPVYDGDELGFLQENDAPAPAQIYCAVASTAMGGGDSFPILAVNGDTSSFSLCKLGTFATAQTSIIYKAVNTSSSYIYDSCYPVKIHVVEAQASA